MYVAAGSEMHRRPVIVQEWVAQQLSEQQYSKFCNASWVLSSALHMPSPSQRWCQAAAPSDHNANQSGQQTM
jgi:hypothetical protein